MISVVFVDTGKDQHWVEIYKSGNPLREAKIDSLEELDELISQLTSMRQYMKQQPAADSRIQLANPKLAVAGLGLDDEGDLGDPWSGNRCL